MAITFEGYERRIDKINKTCAEYGIADLEEARKICTDLGFDPYQITEGIQSIAFENAKWAYVLGCAIAVKKGVKTASEAAAAIGIGLQAFCVPGSVAEERKVGLGHGNLGARLLRDEARRAQCGRRPAVHRFLYRRERRHGLRRGGRPRHAFLPE